MKKTIALSVITALSSTAVAEAKGVRMSRSVSGKSVAAKLHRLLWSIRTAYRYNVTR